LNEAPTEAEPFSLMVIDMPRDDWAKASRKQVGERERRALDYEQAVEQFLKTKQNYKNKKPKSKQKTPSKRQERTARYQEDSRKKVIDPIPSKPGTVFEPMICMDCETVYTTDDTHIRMNSKVLCIKCEGMLTLLHQYDADRDECELDVRLKETLRTTL
jgi:hypothetical protein